MFFKLAVEATTAKKRMVKRGIQEVLLSSMLDRRTASGDMDIVCSVTHTYSLAP